MLLVADSGSTKTQWWGDESLKFETIGFNPFFHSSESVLTALQSNSDFKNHSPKFTEVIFYGSGCSSDERKKVISDALSVFFLNATIKVGHDMDASAYATYMGRPTISCIIGTGSNSCLFDGQNCTEVVPSLGYILGDEGSGGYFGKKLLIAFLYHQLPEATHAILQDKYELDKEKIFDAVYKKPHANVYMASFAKVLSESPDKEYIQDLVKSGMKDFVKQHVCCYPDYKNYPVSFVGSISFYFADIIREVLDEFGCEVGVIIKDPIERLFEWHKKNRF
jgi:glucosamine kinase